MHTEDFSRVQFPHSVQLRGLVLSSCCKGVFWPFERTVYKGTCCIGQTVPLSFFLQKRPIYYSHPVNTARFSMPVGSQIKVVASILRLCSYHG